MADSWNLSTKFSPSLYVRTGFTPVRFRIIISSRFVRSANETKILFNGRGEGKPRLYVGRLSFIKYELLSYEKLSLTQVNYAPMLHKARFIAYINLVIFFLLLMITIQPGIIVSFIGTSVSLFSMLFLLVMLIWGTVNAVRFFRKPGLSGWDRLFLLLAPVNLTYLLVVLGVLGAMVE